MAFPVAAAIQGAEGIATSAFNAYQTVQNNDMQLKLSRTAHQREVGDLRAAGLNPILSATGGRGAALPSLQAPQLSDAGPGVNDAISKSLERDLTQAQIDKTRAEASSAQSMAWLNDQTRWFNYHEAESNAALKLNDLYKSDVGVETPVLKAYQQSLLDQYSQTASASKAAALSLPELRAEAALYSSPLGKYVPMLRAGMGGVHSALDAAAKLK